MSISGAQAPAQIIQKSMRQLRPFTTHRRYTVQQYCRTISLHNSIRGTPRLHHRHQLGASETSGASTPAINHPLNGESGSAFTKYIKGTTLVIPRPRCMRDLTEPGSIQQHLSQSLTVEVLFICSSDWHAGQALEDHKDAIQSPETADVGITESGAVVTVPTPDILEQSERFAEKELIADADLDTSLAQVLPSVH